MGRKGIGLALFLLLLISPLARATIYQNRVVDHYEEVVHSVKTLIDQEGLLPEEILVVSDWDEVIDRSDREAPASRLRYLRRLRKLGVPFMVLTARDTDAKSFKRGRRDGRWSIYHEHVKQMYEHLRFELALFQTFKDGRERGGNDLELGQLTQATEVKLEHEGPMKIGGATKSALILEGIVFSYFKAGALATLIDRKCFNLQPKGIVFIDDVRINIDEFKPIFENRDEKVILLHYPTEEGLLRKRNKATFYF